MSNTSAEREKRKWSSPHDHDADHDHYDTHVEVASVVDDGKAAIPLGTFDPVYEAKARVLNNAVSTFGQLFWLRSGEAVAKVCASVCPHECCVVRFACTGEAKATWQTRTG